jgi:hypothetical protein
MLDCIVVDFASETAAGPAVSNMGFALAHVVDDAMLADTLVDWEVDLAGISDLEAGFAGTAAGTFGSEADLAAGSLAHTAPNIPRHLCCRSHLPDDDDDDEGSSWVAGKGAPRNELRKSGEGYVAETNTSICLN